MPGGMRSHPAVALLAGPRDRSPRAQRVDGMTGGARAAAGRLRMIRGGRAMAALAAGDRGGRVRRVAARALDVRAGGAGQAARRAGVAALAPRRRDRRDVVRRVAAIAAIVPAEDGRARHLGRGRAPGPDRAVAAIAAGGGGGGRRVRAMTRETARRPATGGRAGPGRAVPRGHGVAVGARARGQRRLGVRPVAVGAPLAVRAERRHPGPGVAGGAVAAGGRRGEAVTAPAVARARRGPRGMHGDARALPGMTAGAGAGFRRPQLAGRDLVALAAGDAAGDVRGMTRQAAGHGERGRDVDRRRRIVAASSGQERDGQAGGRHAGGASDRQRDRPSSSPAHGPLVWQSLHGRSPTDCRLDHPGG